MKLLKSLLAKMTLIASLFVIASIGGCDMSFIKPPQETTPEENPTDEEIASLEKDGRYLKVLNLPLNTQKKNFVSAVVLNSIATVAKYDKTTGGVTLVSDGSSVTAYVPLVYSSGEEFIETGPFYIEFAFYVDALTWIEVTAENEVLVRFVEGRGTLDVLTLPEDGISPAWPVSPDPITDPDDIEQLEREGHFLKVLNLPLNTQKVDFKSASVLNSVSAIAKYDKSAGGVTLADSGDSVTAYIPLLYSTGAEFTETGPFYVEFTFYIDALTWVEVTADHKVLVQFTEGRGTLDVLSLPEGALSPDWPVDPKADPDDIEQLEREGHYLKVLNLPLNTQKADFTSASVRNSVSTIAKYDKTTGGITLALNASSVTAYIPLIYNSGAEFTETGAFYVELAFYIDALTWIEVTAGHNIIVQFTQGRGTLDVLSLPEDALSPDWPVDPKPTPDDIEQLEREGHFLKVLNLPLNTQRANFREASVLNSLTTIAKFDRSAGGITLADNANSVTAYIPLVYSSGGEFVETGSFFVTLSFYIDAYTWIEVVASDKITVQFTQGRGTLDVLSLPEGTISPDWPVDPPSDPPADPGDIEQLEREGHFLKVLNLPLNTQKADFKSASVLNSVTTVGRYNTSAGSVTLADNTDSITAYIPLVYNSGGEFVETGSFYVQLSFYIDALTWIEVTASHKVLVYFQEGRGTLDVLSLPEDAISPDWPVTPPSGGGGGGGGGEDSDDPDDIEKLIRDGHYLELYHLPAETLTEHVSSVYASDGSKTVAHIDPYAEILISKQTTAANVYVPLASPSGDVFSKTGSFYVSFTIQIDALTKITVKDSDHIAVEFTEGRGILDIESLIRNNPGFVDPAPGDPDEEKKIEDIISSGGGYIRFFNLPRTVSANKFSAVAVSDSSRVVARFSGADTIAIRKGALTSEAFVPLYSSSSSSSTYFLESGEYLLTFTITIDALTVISADSSYPIQSTFIDGVTDVDAALVQPPPEAAPGAPHCLTITNLPLTAGPSNFADIYVHNSNGVVAKCSDYSLITVSIHPTGSSKKAAVIPLVYDNSKTYNGLDFADSGSFLVTFSFFSGVTDRLLATTENNWTTTFTNGSATIDAATVPQIPRRYLTITNLPGNTQELNIEDVFVWNQAGKIAKCEDYSLAAVNRSGSLPSLSIPLVYSDSGLMFQESGPYYVTFDLNADALTRILIEDSQSVLVTFNSGNGTLNVSTLPKELPVPYLTIINLPANTAKGNFSNVFLYNMEEKVAKCYDYSEINITKTSSSATAQIPLGYNSGGGYFRDSGPFIVTFTINIDANTQIIKERDDFYPLTVTFTDGSGTADASKLPSGFPALTFTNLPVNTAKGSFSNIFVYNAAAKIAKCSNYDDIVITKTATAATAQIPLVYNSGGDYFRDSGKFIVSFDINVDADTQFIKEEDDLFPSTVTFTNGSGTLDVATLPKALPVPTLQIVGLPANTARGNFSEVFVHNAAGKVAKCSNYEAIGIEKIGDSVSAAIPLVYYTASSGDTEDPDNPKADVYFRDSGQFVVSFTINVDANVQIIKLPTDLFTVDFVEGSGLVDLSSDKGYFSGALKNPTDNSAPVVARGTVFEMNGGYIQISSDTQVQPITLTTSALVYIYAYQNAGTTHFEYSTTKPTYSIDKRGFYNTTGNRALWKLVFIKGSSSDLYLDKTYIEDDFTQFDYHTLTNGVSSSSFSGSAFYTLSGATNTIAQYKSFPAGGYVFFLQGAGGGGSSGIDGNAAYDYYGGNGGNGGAIIEFVTLNADTSMTLYASTGGSGASSQEATPSNAVGENASGKNSVSWPAYPGGTNGGDDYFKTWYVSTSGGGGGAGTFVYSSEGYLLLAGGGGGGGGVGIKDPTNFESTVGGGDFYGGGGGAGGCIGKGGSGGLGAAGTYFDTDYNSKTYLYDSNRERYITTTAGTGGGSSNYPYLLISTATGFGGATDTAANIDVTKDGTRNGGGTGWQSTAGGNAAYNNSATETWKNTNSANGQGGAATTQNKNGTAGGNGGNNRNTTKGGGAAGGAGGSPSTGSASAGKAGAAGSITVFKVF